MAEQEAPVIGIDIGTSYSRVGIYKNGEIKIFASKEGNSFIPSCVAFTESGYLVGDKAMDQFHRYLSNTIYGAKHLIGCHSYDHQLQSYMKHYPFVFIFADDQENIQIKVNYKGEERELYIDEIITLIISELKDIAEFQLGMKVNKAVISVPSGFNSCQRQAIKDAANNAGLQVDRLINDACATAIAYGLKNSDNGENHVITINWGGGNLDISVITMENNIFEVKSYAHQQIGGDDFDSSIVQYFVNDFERKHNKNLTNDKFAMQRLRVACESVKKTLSTSSHAVIEINSLYENINFRLNISRTDFENLCVSQFRSIVEPVESALRSAKLDKSQIHKVVLAGGSIRIPKIHKFLQDFFHGQNLYVLENSDEAVVTGAAILAAILVGEKSDKLWQMLLLDATTLSLGVEDNGGVMKKIIKRHATIPTKASDTVSINIMSQIGGRLPIRIYEGEHAMVKDNKLIDTIMIDPKIPLKTYHQVEVSFDIDSNSNVRVSAVDQTSSKDVKTSDVGTANSPAVSDPYQTTNEDVQSLAEHCAKVRTAVDDILFECIEIDRRIKSKKISNPSQCKHRRDRLNQMIKSLFETTFQTDEGDGESSTTSNGCD